ncbi:hypothetical protein WJX73_007899 [Symbiochloris irregularis]|uniref:Uncharacterized protein n=1 Tax=Symbiochloris irregularis TaxID=706552 RepID=A0AAW1NRW3_9CHLO
MVTDLKVDYPENWELLDTYGALPCLHPTHAHFYDPVLKATLEWWSTRHRKAKPVKVTPDHGKVIRREGLLTTRLWGGNRWTDYTNPSWWEAQGFLLGSICWCVNGTFAMWELTNENAQSYVIGYTGLVGATLFQLGGVSGFLEAVNRPNEGPIRFGYDVEKLDSKEPTEFYQCRIPVQPGSGHYPITAARQYASKAQARLHQPVVIRLVYS